MILGETPDVGGVGSQKGTLYDFCALEKGHFGALFFGQRPTKNYRTIMIKLDPAVVAWR